jgi:hypothetical protein
VIVQADDDLADMTARVDGVDGRQLTNHPMASCRSHFHRWTAVTRLALVGCTEAEIAAITGHSLRDVRSILDAHYTL